MLRLSFCTALTLTALLPAQHDRAQTGQHQPPAAPGGAAPRTPQQEIETLVAAARAGDAVAFWDWLPASYQSDVEGLLHDLADRVDAKVWERSMQVAARIAAIGIDKQQFVLGNPTVARAMAGGNGQSKASATGYRAVMTMLREVATSELRTVEGLRTFDGRAFVQKTGGPMLQAIFAIAKEQGHDAASELQHVRVALLQQKGNKAKVELSAPGEPAKIEELVLTEGRWVPEAFVHQWPRTMQRARAQVAALPEGGDQRTMAQFRLMLGTVESMVRKFEDAETQAEFDAACQEAMTMSQRPAAPNGR